MKAYDIVIAGVVQGIGFRYFTRMTANKLGICGWVRNCPNGSVELHAEGEDKLLEKFLFEIRKGPSGMVVDSFVIKETPADFFFGFEIR